MKEVYFEIQLSNNPKSLKMRKHLLKCLLRKDISFQEDINPFKNTVLLTISEDDERLKTEERELKRITKEINTLKDSYRPVKCHYDYTRFIMDLFKKYSIKFKIIDNALYYCPSKNSIFLERFLKIFDKDIIYSIDDLTYFLNLKRISLPPVNLSETPEKLISDILNHDNKSNYFLIESKKDKINIERINRSENPRFYYNHSTLKSKYILLTSLVKVNKENNLPTNTISKMIKNLSFRDEIETFNYYYYKLLAKSEKIDDFQFNTFPEINLAISHIIDLEKIGIRGILIENNVCYRNKERIKFLNNCNINREYISEILRNLTSDDFIFEDYTLKDLVNMQIRYRIPYPEESDTIIDYDMVENKGMNMYNLTGKITDFSIGKFPKFNRDNINLSLDFEVELIEKIDTYYSPIITIDGTKFMIDKDFYFPYDIKKIRIGFDKMFTKGYFLTDFGLMRYINTGEISKRDICIPGWLKSDNDIEFKILLNFISLMIL